jgi:acetate kinase
MILILNCGSQSIKWKVFDLKLKLKDEGKKEVFRNGSFKKILKKELKSIKYEIDLVGHRVVHGGQYFRKPIEIDSSVLKKLKKVKRLAPLHNPYNMLGIKISKKLFPKAKQMAVFDTGFYKDLPEVASVYALPDNLRDEYRRFGFHGISHEFVLNKVSKLLKKPTKEISIISCHLGGGSSITAIKNGKAVDTSMGYTPLEGLAMMTRAGDIDPGIILDLVERYGLKKVKNILNNKSGLKAISHESEMLKILKGKNKKSKLALDYFVYKILKYIGSYSTILGNIDAVVFTGTIGAGDPKTRNLICKNIKNIKIIVIEPNEELAIAQKII